MSKCTCGYEIRLPGEQEMFDQWGCARAVAIQGTLGTGVRVTLCSIDSIPPVDKPEDTKSLDEAFKEKYMRNKPDKK